MTIFSTTSTRSTVRKGAQKVSGYGGRVGRIGLLVTSALAAAVLSGCGDGDAASQPETSKRLSAGGPCDLVTAAEVGQILGSDDVEVDPTDEIQCDYSSTSLAAGANVIRGQNMSKMTGDEQVDLEGVEGTRLNSTESSCGVSVVLSPDDPAQQFAVISSLVPSKLDKPVCDVADEIATAILAKLPG
jgi:hypothetical protein